MAGSAQAVRPPGLTWAGSPHYSQRPKGAAPVLLVLHATATPLGSLGGVVHAFQDRAHRPAVSAHAVIGEDGDLVCCVDVRLAAWHAGRSEWEDPGTQRRYRDGAVNGLSIGVELVNPCDGRTYYKEPQLEALHALVTFYLAQCREYYGRECLRYVAAHSDVARPHGRRSDPGPLFPWVRFLLETGLERTP